MLIPSSIKKHIFTIRKPSFIYTNLRRNYRKMASTSLDLSPPINRQMTELDRSFFHKEFDLVYAYFQNPIKVGEFVKTFSKDVFKLRKLRNVLKFDDGTRGVVLNEELRSIDQSRNVLSDQALKFIEDNNIELRPYKLEIDYDFWKLEDILTAILPQDLSNEIPSGFTITGHIAHLNLRKEFKPFGKLIGQVILDKNPTLKTVVNKLDSIHHEYRYFDMEILAGENNLIVEQKESNCVFKFDFSKVYWNSRLHTEHERLIKQKFKSRDLVFDVMAGVGPFSVPAGKNNVFVLSNDLNPESYKYMAENVTRNKVEGFVKPFNLDGRLVIQDSLKYLEDFRKNDKVIITRKRKLENNETSKEEIVYEIPNLISHYVMNLPDSALLFLNEFNGIFHGLNVDQVPGFKLPYIHVYCFEKFSHEEEEPSEIELHKRVFEKIKKIVNYEGFEFEKFEFHLVRKVSPTKPMYCVSFQLPEEVAFRKREDFYIEQ